MSVCPGWKMETGEYKLGRIQTFAFTPVPNPIFQSFYTPLCTNPAGLYGKLESTADTCNGLLVRQASGAYACGLGLPGQTFQITAWKYTDPTGRAYTWSRTAGLQSIQDLNGNKLTFSPAGITSTAGNLNVPIQRDTLGRITRITDPLGKHYQYGYNAQGDLETVTYPGIATAAQFTYDPGHLLKDYRDPRGTLASTRTYYPGGRLQSITEAGQTTQYAYNTAARTMTITHPDAGLETIESDDRGNVTRRVDGLKSGRRSIFCRVEKRGPHLPAPPPINRSFGVGRTGPASSGGRCTTVSFRQVCVTPGSDPC